jgi:DNA-binding response OmpR family regulator
MGESNIIEVYIRALRMKLKASNSKRLLHTVRGVGYVLREQKRGGADLQILGI